MSCTRTKIVNQARSWIGCNEADGSHKKIIDTYNSHTPRARGYKLKYTDAWCAGFVSACAIACGATDIIPIEVSCQKLIGLFQSKGLWVENDAYVPKPGDYIFYDWQDTGAGDNKGNSDHVGIVEKVVDGVITVIEGNYSNSVKRRTIKVNGKYIRGYGVPKYDEETEEVKTEVKKISLSVPQLSYGLTGESVKALQILLSGRGCNGDMHKPDGIFGPNTLGAVKLYQKKEGLEADGVVGPITWAKLLGV